MYASYFFLVFYLYVPNKSHKRAKSCATTVVSFIVSQNHSFGIRDEYQGVLRIEFHVVFVWCYIRVVLYPSFHHVKSIHSSFRQIHFASSSVLTSRPMNLRLSTYSSKFSVHNPLSLSDDTTPNCPQWSDWLVWV